MKCENMAKKVKFYQSEKAQGKYQVPNDIKDLVSVTDESELMDRIRKRVNSLMKKEIKNVEKME